MRRVAEQALTLGPGTDRFWTRVHAPRRGPRNRSWRCRVENPLWWNVARHSFGETPLQALSHGLSQLSVELYASSQYGMGEPRLDGAADHNLGIPAQHLFLDRAPFPFSLERVQGQGRFAVVNDAGWDARLLAEEVYAVAGSRRRLRARIYAPRLTADGRTWASDVSVGQPLGMRGRGVGPNGLQALVASLALLSKHLYGSSLYRAGRLGWGPEGSNEPVEFGGHLLLPAVTEVLDVAPYPV